MAEASKTLNQSKEFHMATRINSRGPRMSFIIGWLLLSCQLLSDGNAFGQAAPFYKDKTIRIVVGFTAGGLYDQ